MKVQQTSVSNGLSTDTHQVKTAGMYTIYAASTCLQPSSLVITISQTGSTSASITSATTSPLELVVSANKTFNCAVGDILTVAVTSSAPVDQPPSLLRTTINLRQGL